MLKFISSIGAALTLLLASGAQAEEVPAALPYPEVTIFEAAKIITMEPGYPEARYVATADGIILGLGQTLEDLEAWTRDREVTVDRQFAKQILMPGFVEPHVHPMQTIMMLPMPFISPEEWKLPGKTYPAARGKAQYEERLRAEMAKSEDALFITWGHHKLFHGDMDRAELDRIAPDRPVVIWQRSFHEIIANSKALTLLGIGDEAAFTAAFSKPLSTPAMPIMPAVSSMRPPCSTASKCSAPISSRPPRCSRVWPTCAR
ncbi:hypothetical protein C8024_17615 [Sphingopyxis sp. BSNA05]|uniref:amidohydrolase family protein n=1 Tax=Sphingopyxis sp. BSNA05 TaxID=1236614 RepID=UPI0015677134|nr:amidohydrolase family protein [Sphingopyxis sp. BSNA05]NRD90875.1 hypothetical protein [Sphingopyxis sp. BSNA05]